MTSRKLGGEGTMNRLLTVGLAIALSGAAVAAEPVELPYKDVVGDYTNDSFTVLDLSVAKGWAVVKVVAHMRGNAVWPDSVDCKYPGMSATPTSGVTLATWDLRAGKPGSSYVVYAIADSSDDCSPEATNTKNLTDAKAEAARLGLDVTRKPAPVLPTGDVFPLVVGGKDVRVTAKVDTVYGPDMDPGTSTITLTTGDGRVVYHARSSGASVVKQAYVEGTKAVFVVLTTGLWGQNYFFLTTPIELGA